jgi:NTP pyrophosphatase (non-canonical NTP hydrolase)
MPPETSASIAQWAEATFGPAPDLGALQARAAQELAELALALAKGDRAETLAEAADVTILLHRIAALSGGDLAQAVDAKMVVNRARVWLRSGDGTGRHI